MSPLAGTRLAVGKLNRTNAWLAVPAKKRHLPREQIGPWITAVQEKLIGLKGEREHRDALMFLVLTGCRVSEALGNDADGYPPLRWEDVDFPRKVVTFRNTKNRTDHELPLREWLCRMLEERKAVSGAEFVFSAPDGSRPGDLRGAIDRIKAETGIRVTAHDLRRSFATTADSLDIGRYTVTHVEPVGGGDVTAGYVQVDTDRGFGGPCSGSKALSSGERG